MNPRSVGRAPRSAPRHVDELSPRQRQVLELLVRQFLATARPVASQALAVEGGFAWAPATLRQAMNELEDLGLLEQPHAAAGRVPTDRGYRLFVDALAAPAAPTEAEREAIDRAVSESLRDVGDLLTQVSRTLAELSTQVGFALAPAIDDAVLAGLELVPLAEGRALLVLALEGGVHRPVTVDVESPLGRDELARVGALLRERLLGRTLREARRRLSGDEALVRDSAVALVSDFVVAAIARAVRPGVFVGGTAHAARHPEFREAQSLRPLLELVDRSEPWRDLVHGEEPGLAVTIGREHGRPEWAHLSLVSFRLPGPGDVSIGLLGPRRMDYARIMGLVDYAGRRLPSPLGPGRTKGPS